MNQLEICQARYRSNTWMGRTRTDGPDEFEPSKFDCINHLFSHSAWKYNEVNRGETAYNLSYSFGNERGQLILDWGLARKDRICK